MHAGCDWAGILCARANATRSELECRLPKDADERVKALALEGIGMTIVADIDTAIEFLSQLKPTGPWTLTAFCPEKSGNCTRTFTELKNARAFIDKYNTSKEWNIHFTANRVSPEVVDKKPCATDITHLDYLHVDLDPRAGEEPATEKERILKLLKAHDPSPTIIIDSGNGFNALWKLIDPQKITDPEKAKLHNLHIEREMGGDSCSNVDRVLRLPGTINFPNAAKRKKRAGDCRVFAGGI